MQKTAARIFLGLPGLFIMTAGLVFLSNPAAAADKLRLVADTPEALSNLRGLAGAPIFAVGLSLIASAITQKLEYARPAVFFLFALIAARIASHAIDGPSESLGLFLAVPMGAFALMALGHVQLVKGEDAAPPVA